MAEIIIPSGVTSTGLVAESGDIIVIEAGGKLVDGVIKAGGTLKAVYGAVAEDLTAETGATVELSEGAKTSGLMLTGENTNIAEGTLYYQGAAVTGTVTNGTLSNLNGVYRVCIGDGITATDPTVGGETTVGVRVYAQENAIVSGGSITTSGNIGLLDTAYGNGVTVGGEGVTKANYNTFDNATADNTIVSEGGQFTVRYKADNTTVNAGGNMIVSNLGIADGITLSGTLHVSDGGRAENVNAYAGAAVNVSNGGRADHVTMNGGALTVSKGGVVYDLDAKPGTTFTVSGGAISGAVIVGHNGATANPWLHSDAFINDVTLRADETYYSPQNYAWIRLGNTGADKAYASNVKIESAGKFQVNNGYAENVSATTYGGAIVYNNDQSGKAGASASRIFVSNHGIASVYTRPGVAEHALMTEVWIGSGGVAKVGKGEGDGSGGEMRDAILNPGGSMYVYNNGVAQLDDHPWIDKSHLTVYTGGAATSARGYDIYYGTEEAGVSARAKGRQENWMLNADSAVVYDGATISGAEVASGATFAMKGGWVSGASFDSGAIVRVEGGTILDISAVRMKDEGVLRFSGAVLVSGGYIAGDGDRHTTGSATFFMTDDAVLRDVKITNVANVSKSNVVWGMMGDTKSTETGSAYAYNCTVEKGARLQMYHGVAYDTTITTGAMFNIAYGSAVRTTISGGAYNGAGEGARMILHYAAGRVYDTTVGSGGTMTISNGRASDTTVSSGGSLTVVGGVASGLVMEAGARFTMTGGTVSGATIRTTVGSGLGGFTGGTIYDLTVEGPASATTRKFYVANNAVVSGGLVRTDAADHGLEFYVSGGAQIHDVTFTTDVIDATGNINYTRLGWGAGNVGYTYDCTVQSGAKLQMNNGRVYNTTVKDGGCVTVWGYTTDGAYAENTSVFGNGLNTYEYAGAKYGAVVLVSAQAGNSAVMSGAFIGSGGFIDISQSGAVMNVLVNSGGSMRLNAATAQALVDYNPFIGEYTAALIRKNYGAAVLTYQTEDERAYKVYYGANDGKTGLIFRTNETEFDNFNVEVGHSMHIYEGQALNTFVQSGGVLSLGGANATATVDYNPWGGATIVNDKGGTVTSQTREQRGYNVYFANEEEGVFSRTNAADGETIANGVTAKVFDGAELHDITASGRLDLYSGAVVSNLYVSGGGYLAMLESVSSGGKNYGGSAYDVTLGKGAGAWFASGNYISGLTIESGGSINVYHFGQIHNTVISNGGQIELRTNGIATSNMRGGVIFDLAGDNTANRYMVTRNFQYISGAVVKANGEVADSTYYLCSNAGASTTANAFKLDIGGGNVYDTDATNTEFFDPIAGLNYKRTRNQLGTTTSYDLRLETEVTARKLTTVAEAAAVAADGETFNGSDRGARWTGETDVLGNVYIAQGMTTGNAWLEIDGATVENGTALYGAAANQDFAGVVNLKLTTGSIRNLAAGAAEKGSVKAVNFTMAGGTLAGNAYAGGFGNVTETITTVITDGTLASGKDFYAGALANYAKTSTATTVGDINLTVEDGTFGGNIYGASAVKASVAAAHTAGNVSLKLAGGTAANTDFCCFAGGYATGSAAEAKVYTVGDIAAEVSGGSWGEASNGRGFFGGAFASGVKAEAQDVTITISGGTFGNVFGGGWAQKGGTSIVDDVEINISGGTVANVFGGGTHSTSGGATTVDDVEITISGGSITGAIYAGGQGVNDNVTGDEIGVNFTGDTNFVCGVYGYSYGGGTIGDATLSYTGYTGTFSGAVGGFAGITFDGGTAMTLATAAADVSNGKWEFDFTDRADTLAGTSFLTWDNADFANDTVKVNFADAEQAASGWNIADAAFDATTTFTLAIGGTEITTVAYDTAIAEGDWAGWKFTDDNGTLKFKQLA